MRDIPKYERSQDFKDRQGMEGDQDQGDLSGAMQDLSEMNDRETIQDALFEEGARP